MINAETIRFVGAVLLECAHASVIVPDPVFLVAKKQDGNFAHVDGDGGPTWSAQFQRCWDGDHGFVQAQC